MSDAVLAPERTEGPTPNGGAYSLTVYVILDSWQAVPRERATGAIVTEYDENDQLVFETVTLLNSRPAPKPS